MAARSKSVRGSKTARPVMALLDLLGQRWTLRIIWELRAERLSFRGLRERCDDVSPTVLNTRLKDLRDFEIVDLDDAGYGLTRPGRELGTQLGSLDAWARRWIKP